MSQSFNNFSLINLPGILSPTFINKKSDSSLLLYQTDEQLNRNNTLSIVDAISQEINCNPDGWILFVSNTYKSQIKKIIEKDFLKAHKQKLFNFADKNYSETILYHEISNGVIIELIDTSYGSLFFYDLMENIQEFTDKLNLNFHDFLFFELVHMSTNIHSLKNEDHGYHFINLLRKNNIEYMQEVKI